MAFHTGLMAYDYCRFPDPPYVGNRWHLDLAESRAGEYNVGSVRIGGKEYPAKEVLIFAGSEVAAQRSANLVHAARLLTSASNELSLLGQGEHPSIRRVDSRAPNLATEEWEHAAPKFLMVANIPLACQIAARASFRLQYVYALAKLRLSFELFSVHLVELDPTHSANLPKSPFPEDHVRLAFAIVTAWSGIEELGFEIRASEKKPSKLPDGNWNPVVKEELEARLRKGGINLDEPFHWNLRGAKTRIENKRAPNIVQRAPWARYHVRDGKMEVIDAIYYVSFLRSWIAAHKVDKQLLRVLSAYEAANAQFLARRLLLEKLGFWRQWGEHPGT